MQTRSTFSAVKLPATERARYVRNPITGYFEKQAFFLPNRAAPTLPDALRLEDAFSGQIQVNAAHVLTVIRNPSEPLALGRAPIFTGIILIAPKSNYPRLFYGNRKEQVGNGFALSDIVFLFSDCGQFLIAFRLIGKHYERAATRKRAALLYAPEMAAMIRDEGDFSTR